MTGASREERVLAAPPHLGLETRLAFRREAIRILDSMPEGLGWLTIDMSATEAVDSTGLNALVLVRRHAARRRVAVRLRGVSDQLRYFLVLTKLDNQFELEAGTDA